MNRILPLFVTGALALSSVWAGVDSYLRTESRICDDLTRAVALTALEQPADWLSTDTIRCFRNHLQMTELREGAYLCLQAGAGGGGPETGNPQAMAGTAGQVAGAALQVAPQVQAQGYAECSALTIWWLSDQRLAGMLAVLTALMLGMSLRRVQAVETAAEQESAQAETAAQVPSPFTPMQEQLLQLLLAAPTRELTKQELCDALWPRKDNAAETLYTLIHRIKPVLEAHTDLRIVSNRGRSYRLEPKEPATSGRG